MVRNSRLCEVLKLISMKTILISVIALTICSTSFSQNFSQLKEYEFTSTESYRNEQNKVLNCVNYLFDNPVNKDELHRLISIQYIIKWMEGTPDFTFEIGEEAMELTKGRDDLFGLYLAAMTKVVLENKDGKLGNSEIYNRSEQILVDYCSYKENSIKPSKKIKRLIKSKK